VSLFAAVVIGAGVPPIVDLYHRISALEYQRGQNTEEFQAELSDREETMDDIARIVESPVPLWPPASTHMTSPLIELRWTAPTSHPSGDYLVEIRDLGQQGNSKVVYASNPDEGTHHLSDLGQGEYAWRVAKRLVSAQVNDSVSSDNTHGSTDLWSGYSTFSIGRQTSSKELTVAINYAQQSRFMKRTPDGHYCGYDADLITFMGIQET
jgi:hypothetical protein